MVHRRTFLKLASAATGALYARAVLAHPPEPRLHRIVVDDRFDDSARFARAAAALSGGTEILPQGDITRFWHESLQRDWERAPLALAGTTGPEPLFCLRTLARDHGLRLVIAVPRDPAAGDGWAADAVAGARRALDRPRPLTRPAPARPGQLVTWVIAPPSWRLA